MPTITLDKKDVLKLIGRNVPDNVLKERIPMLGTDLEEVTSSEIKVEIFPNRTDMLTEEGFARALSSFLNIKTGLRSYKINASSYKFTVDPKVKAVRPAVAAAVIKEVKMDDAAVKSIMDMQDKLTLTHGRNRKKVAVGVHDLDTITFPLTYTTKPRDFTFAPLGTNKPFKLHQIINDHPKGREFGHLLAGYREFPVWIDSKKQVLSMPPIVNAEETKVTEKTRNLFLDVTGTDQQAVEQALNIMVASLAERGGKIFKVNNFPNMDPKKIRLDFSSIQKTLGITLNQSQVKRLLELMGMTLQGNTVLYPTYRTDILHQVDIIEDIAVAYGYEKLQPEIPRVATIAEEDSLEKLKNKVAEILIGLNLTEVNTYHIAAKESQTTMMNYNMECIEIANPQSKEYNVLRAWMMPSLMEVLKNNRQHEYPQRIFEIGAIFRKKDQKEMTHLAVMIADANADFTQARQIAEAMCASLNLPCSIKETEHASFIPGRVGSMSINKKECGFLGEIHPAVLEKFQIEMPVAAIEIDLSSSL